MLHQLPEIEGSRIFGHMGLPLRHSEGLRQERRLW